VHPLAGQGVNLGIGDASELAQQLQSAIANGQPWGMSSKNQSRALLFINGMLVFLQMNLVYCNDTSQLEPQPIYR
jgi:hypothetical protein